MTRKEVAGLSKLEINSAFGSVIYKIGGDPKLVYIDIKNIAK